MGKKKTTRAAPDGDLAVDGNRVTAPTCAPGYAPTSRAAKATKHVPIAPGQTVELAPTGCAPKKTTKKTKATAPPPPATRADSEAPGWDDAWAHEVLARAVYLRTFMDVLERRSAEINAPAHLTKIFLGERESVLRDNADYERASRQRLAETCAGGRCAKTPAEIEAAAARYATQAAERIVQDIDLGVRAAWPRERAVESTRDLYYHRVDPGRYGDLRHLIYTHRGD